MGNKREIIWNHNSNESNQINQSPALLFHHNSSIIYYFKTRSVNDRRTGAVVRTKKDEDKIYVYDDKKKKREIKINLERLYYIIFSTYTRISTVIAMPVSTLCASIVLRSASYLVDPAMRTQEYLEVYINRLLNFLRKVSINAWSIVQRSMRSLMAFFRASTVRSSICSLEENNRLVGWLVGRIFSQYCFLHEYNRTQ